MGKIKTENMQSFAVFDERTVVKFSGNVGSGKAELSTTVKDRGDYYDRGSYSYTHNMNLNLQELDSLINQLQTLRKHVEVHNPVVE